MQCPVPEARLALVLDRLMALVLWEFFRPNRKRR